MKEAVIWTTLAVAFAWFLRKNVVASNKLAPHNPEQRLINEAGIAKGFIAGLVVSAIVAWVKLI